MTTESFSQIEKQLQDAMFYGRVSTDDQTSTQQVEEGRIFAKDRGLNLRWVFVDDGVSGKRRDRPGLNQALEVLRSGQCKIVVVKNLTRLGRSFAHIHELLQEFKNRKIRLISITDGIDTADDSPYTRAYLRLMSTFAELQREMLVENTKSKLDSYKRQISEKGYFVTKTGEKKTRLGRPAGSKDKAPRNRSGYWLRFANKGKGALMNA